MLVREQYARNFCAIVASVAGVYPARLSEPTLVGMSLVFTLSFGSIGIPWSGPTNFPVARKWVSSASRNPSRYPSRSMRVGCYAPYSAVFDVIQSIVAIRTPDTTNVR